MYSLGERDFFTSPQKLSDASDTLINNLYCLKNNFLAAANLAPNKTGQTHTFKFSNFLK